MKIFSNVIKSDDEMRIEIRKLERELEDESTESKITEFGSDFAEKSSNEQERNFRHQNSRKTEIEIDSNYDLKMKFKAI